MSDATIADTPAGIKQSRGFGSAYLHRLILIFFLANMLVTMDRTALGVLIVPIRAELRLDDSQLGALSFAFAAFYALFGLVLGRLTDTSDRSKLLAWSTGLLGIATVICGWTYSFFQLFVARMLCGVGEAGSVPTKYSIIGDSFRPEQRASALALIYAGSGVGASLGFALAGVLAETIGWRLTFTAMGVPALLVGVAIYISVREPQRGVFEAAEAAQSRAGMGATFRALARNRTFVFIVLAYSLSIFGTYGIGYWIPSFLIRTHGLSLTDVGLVYGSISGFSLIGGMITGASVSTKLMRRDRRFEMWLPGIVNILVGCAFAAVFTTRSLPLALTLIGVSGFLGGLMIGPATAGIQSTVPARMRGVAASITMFVSALVGQGLGPWVIGHFSDTLGASLGDRSLATVMFYSTGFFVLCGALYLWGARNYHNDRVD